MSEVINLNDTVPASPALTENVRWLKGPQTGVDITTGLPIFPVSANVPAASTSSLGVVRPDGTTILIDPYTGVISAGATGSIGVTVDGGGTPPTTGTKGYLKVPFNCTITGWTILADQSGSAVFGIKAASTVAGIGSTTSIVASAPPTLTSAQAVESTTLTGWTTTLTAGNLIEFDLTSVTTCTRLTLEVMVTKT